MYFLLKYHDDNQSLEPLTFKKEQGSIGTLPERPQFLFSHYLSRLKGEGGVKSTGKPYGLWIWQFFALKIYRNVKIELKMVWFSEVFCTLSKSSSILAQKDKKFKFLEVFCFFWYPYHPWKCLSSRDIMGFKVCSSILLQ